MTSAYAEACLGPGTDRQDALQAVEQRVLWLSAAIVHHANRVRSDPSGLKVGGEEGEGRSTVVGDAELDEGACWEAIVDPMAGELGEVVWIIDVNRQSLDRIVPILGVPRLEGMFSAAGWQVLTVKYGLLLRDLFARPGGEALRLRLDQMPNPEYQRRSPGRSAPLAG